MTKKKELITKTVLEKELNRYIENGDTFTARNLLNNFAGEDFPTEKYLKLIEETEKNKLKKNLKEE